MKEYFITVKGIKIRIIEWGNENNPAMLCLHGLGCTSMNFIEIAETLKEEYRLIAIDLPGHGKTEIFKISKDYDFPKFAKWLDLVVSKLNIKDFYMLGHSWGAFISMFYAAEYGSKIKKLLLLDGGYQLFKTMYDYDSLHGNLIWKCKSFEERLQTNINWFYKTFDGCQYTDLNKFIEDEKEDYSRWSPLLSKAHLDTSVLENGIYKFHVKGTTAEIIIRTFYNFQVDLTYAAIKNNNISQKILLLYAEMNSNDENYLKLLEIMLNIFHAKSGIAIRKLPLAHMMHWDNPECIIHEIKNWFN